MSAKSPPQPASLRRCPLCDGPAVIERRGVPWRVSCCLCWLSVDSVSREGATERWNQRPAATLTRLRAMLDAYNDNTANRRMQLVPAISDAELLDEIPAALPLEVRDDD